MSERRSRAGEYARRAGEMESRLAERGLAQKRGKKSSGGEWMVGGGLNDEERLVKVKSAQEDLLAERWARREAEKAGGFDPQRDTEVIADRVEFSGQKIGVSHQASLEGRDIDSDMPRRNRGRKIETRWGRENIGQRKGVVGEAKI